MPETITEQEVIEATGTSKLDLRKLLRLGLITAEPKTINPIEFHPDTIEIIKSMEYKNDNI